MSQLFRTVLSSCSRIFELNIKRWNLWILTTTILARLSQNHARDSEVIDLYILCVVEFIHFNSLDDKIENLVYIKSKTTTNEGWKLQRQTNFKLYSMQAVLKVVICFKRPQIWIRYWQEHEFNFCWFDSLT